ncbi:MAG: hypothetical protein G01um1014107_63 [Parcubacteria group bacterium Gr01-1014_107]|nr:MAG: hypothetical protein G01um1014107_63 [Parcubacteria group bacterium Gr01-1014_107]
MTMNFVERRASNVKGFSLVETMVAIFVLSLGILAFIEVARGGLRSTFYARDRIAAFWLAQEAIEFIKNRRDENGIANCLDAGGQPDCEEGVETHWLKGIYIDAVTGNPEIPCGPNPAQACGVDAWNFTINTCGPQNNNCLLRKDISSGVFNHQSGNNTKFTRKVNVKEIDWSPVAPGMNAVKVTVVVTWGVTLGSGVLTVEETVLNWHPLSKKKL